MREENNLKNWELVNFCEFDKYAIKSYCAIHDVDESLNLGDITKVDETKLKDFNMMTWGFPCTDISVAGKQKGFLDEDGNKTRSGMYYEGIRILRYKKPALSIIENVKNLTSKRFKKEFETVLSDLDEAGYNSYYKILNAKDFGVPQNRERVFIISIRKDLDNGKFVFPKGFDNGIRLKDVLEDEVDDKYYISDDKVQRFLTNLNTDTSLLYDPCQVKREGKSREYNDYCPTLTSRDYKDPRLVNENVVKQVGNISNCNGSWKNPQVGRIYSTDGCSPTLNTCGGGSHEPKIVCGIDKSINDTKQIDYANCLTAREDRGVNNRKSEGTAVLEIPDMSYCLDANYYKGTTPEQYIEKKRRQLVFENSFTKIAIPQATKKGYIECDIGGVADLSYPNSKTRRGRVQDNGNICPTITATETGVCRLESLFRIRKLTPKECFRLMGFNDSAYDAASKVVSNSQLYKQAGNSIVVDVLYYILVELYKAMPYLFDDLKLSSFFSGIGAFEVALDRLYRSINTGNFTKPQVE